MKVIVKRNIMVGGKPYGPGAEIDLEEKEAKYLANAGKVALKEDPKAKKDGQVRETATARGLQTADLKAKDK